MNCSNFVGERRAVLEGTRKTVAAKIGTRDGWSVPIFTSRDFAKNRLRKSEKRREKEKGERKREERERERRETPSRERSGLSDIAFLLSFKRSAISEKRFLRRDAA